MTKPLRRGRVLPMLSVAKGPKGQMEIRVTKMATPVFAEGVVRPEVRVVAMRA